MVLAAGNWTCLAVGYQIAPCWHFPTTMGLPPCGTWHLTAPPYKKITNPPCLVTSRLIPRSSSAPSTTQDILLTIGFQSVVAFCSYYMRSQQNFRLRFDGLAQPAVVCWDQPGTKVLC